LLEIEARLRRFAQGLDLEKEPATEPGLTSAHGDRGLAAVEAMAQFITRNYAGEITVADIAAQAHLHPNYAMTCFPPAYGMTLAQYLVLQRVAQAQRLLATTGISIEKIAFDSGFGSVSRFYEAFRQQTGNSPRRFRLHLAKRDSPQE
jgi:AraC-like DNA-binding protein